MSEVMIEAKGLTKRYNDVLAADKVSFSVRKGEVVGFLGPNGAGKTTTMKMLTCFISPSEGTASVNGCDVFADSLGVRQAIGYLPESTPLYVEMIVAEYLEFVAKMRGLEGDVARARIKRAVEQTGLGEVYAKEIRALSKGFKQRVGLAQALVHEPPILILDEPMSGLDPNQAIEIRDLIREIGKERTVILSTHNLAEVQVACGRVLIIAHGKLVADSTPHELSAKAGGSHYIVTVVSDGGDATRDKVKAALGKVSGVSRVDAKSSADKGELIFEVMPSGSSDLRAELSKAVQESGAALLGLKREEQNLEQIFRQLTVGAQTSEKKVN